MINKGNDLAEPFMSILQESIHNMYLDLLYESLNTILLFVENSKHLIGYFLGKDLVNILIKLIKNNELKNYRIHRSSFSILGDLFLGSEEEIKVSNSPIK